MPLVLARKEGEDFYVGDTRVEVVQISHPHKFYVKVHKGGTKTTVAVTDKKSVEIEPNVLLSAGTNNTPETNGVKIAIAAPRDVRILRGSLYRSKIGEYSFSRRASEQLAQLLGDDYNVDDVCSMIRESAPCTHTGGNRRFENLVFRVKHAVVLNVSIY